MDTTCSINGGDVDRDYPAADEPVMDAPPSIGSDERRMHVRAYNYWVSLLDGRPYPMIADLRPETVADFGPHGVVLDFAADPADPAIPFLGEALRAEGGHETTIAHVSDVPRGSLLSRLTDHIAEIVANHAPIGFEAEFVNLRGRKMMYRGILMPFSSDQHVIDAIYGVINWKEAPAEAENATLLAEVEEALRDVPQPVAVSSPIWADGPNAAPLADHILPQPAHEPLLMDVGDMNCPDQATAFDTDCRNGEAWAYLRTVSPVATLDLATLGADEFLLLVARALPDGRLGVLAPIHDPVLLDRAIRRLAD